MHSYAVTALIYRNYYKQPSSWLLIASILNKTFIRWNTNNRSQCSMQSLPFILLTNSKVDRIMEAACVYCNEDCKAFMTNYDVMKHWRIYNKKCPWSLPRTRKNVVDRLNNDRFQILSIKTYELFWIFDCRSSSVHLRMQTEFWTMKQNSYLQNLKADNFLYF